LCKALEKYRDVVDKVYKPEYKGEMRRKNRYGMDRWSKEKRDKQQGPIKRVEMPRGPRLDAPETLHHVIVRGIERRKIVDNDKDRENFVKMKRYRLPCLNPAVAALRCRR
jgi:hypothetical protein